MTNPDRSELVKLANAITGHVAALANEPLRMPLTIWNVVSNDILAAAESLRRLASSDGGVKVRELEWGESRITGEVGVMAQDAYTSIGHYIASDNGWFLQGQSGWNASASLEAAKAFAQADYEARIRSALITAPPADAGMREAFVRVLASLAAAISILERTPKAKRAVASDKMFDQMLDDYRKALEAGRSALTAPDATTKSDGDGESRRHAETGNKSGAVPEAEQSSSATSFERVSGPEDKTLKPRAGVASGPSDPSQEPKAVAYRYRWKLDGEWTSWHVSDHSQSCEGLRDLEEYPLYPRPVSLNREATARIKSLLVSFHRNSCYPEAMTGELNDAAERILALIEGRK